MPNIIYISDYLNKKNNDEQSPSNDFEEITEQEINKYLDTLLSDESLPF